MAPLGISTPFSAPSYVTCNLEDSGFTASLRIWFASSLVGVRHKACGCWTRRSIFANIPITKAIVLPVNTKKQELLLQRENSHIALQKLYTTILRMPGVRLKLVLFTHLLHSELAR